MRIAMLSWESMHSIAVGGLAPHVTELAGGLARRGHHIHVYTRVGPQQASYDFIDGVHYHRCPYQAHPDFLVDVGRMCNSFVWHLGETEHYLNQPFDVVHGHDWLSTWALAQSKNELRRPAVYTMHSTEFGRCGNCLWEDPLSRRIRDLEWEGTYVADRVICVSRTLRDETIGQYGVPPEKTFAIYNGVNVDKYDAEVDVAAVRRQISVGVDDPMIFFAGRVTWQKGPDLLMEAVPQVLRDNPRAKIVYAGDGDMREGLEQRASASGVSGSTRFLGYRKGADLVGLFKSADLVCVPSRNEPFGIVILEAWSAMKPVVATSIGGPAEFVTHAHNGWKVHPDVDSIGSGLAALLADVEGARQMGVNGRLDAESLFTWDVAAAETEKVYQSIFEAEPRALTEESPERFEEYHDMARQPAAKPRSTNGKAPARTAPPAPKTNRIASAATPTHDEIRRRAYEIFLARGCTPGDPVADWLEAERQLRDENQSHAERPARAAARKTK